MTYRFDPELAPVVPTLPSEPFDDPVRARANMRQMIAALNTEVDTSGLQIENLDADGVGLRLYRPEARSGVTPALLYIHGGGFVVGDLDSEHGSCASIARRLGIAVLSVDYRLAPEHPYPVPLEDCYTALRWLRQRCESLAVDPDRVGVFGQSAGGGLAAALCLLTRDRGGPGICFQFLGMPEVDDRLQTTSMREFTDTPLWNRPNAELSWQYYLGAEYTPGGGDVPIYAAPARAQNLRDLPPAYVTAMEFDPLRDEDVDYAARLMQAGVPTELHTFPGTFHGSSLVTTATVSQRQDAEMIDVLRRGLGCRT